MMSSFRFIGILTIMLAVAVPATAGHGENAGHCVLLQDALRVHGLERTSESVPVPDCGSRTFHMKWNGTVLQDAGINLFPEDMEKIYSPEVYDFIERFFLLFALQTEDGRKNLLRQDHLRLNVNGRDYSSARVAPCSLLQAVDVESPFALNADSSCFYASWQGIGLKVDFVFPKQYDLIFGKDKRMLTEELPSRLESVSDPVAMDKLDFDLSSFQRTALKDVYFDSEGTFLIPQMKSGTYLQRTKEGFDYLFDERFPEESMLNLFTGAFRMDIPMEADLTVKGYRYDSASLITLKRLTAFMDGTGCKAYVGIETVSEGEITGTVVYFNWDLMYEHLLCFRFPCRGFHDKREKAKLVLYPYIPLNNVENLYDDASELPLS